MNRANRRDRRNRADDQQTRTGNRQTRTDRSRRRDDRQRAGGDAPITGRTMRDVSHTHPFTDRGALNRVFERGTRIAADGGERNAGDPEGREHDAREPEDETPEEPGTDAESEANAETGSARMKDVDHTPPHGEGVERVFERGGAEEPVEAEE